jgi:pilus assembly protein Flp/PilA
MVRAYTWARVNIAEFRSWLRDETGGVAAEYALLVTLVAIAIILGATALGTAINDRLDDTAAVVGP